MIHEWQPIKDLDDSFNESVHEELRYLAEIWREQKDEFDPEKTDEFIKKIKREWSIETGLVERVYHFDRGTTETWIEHGLDEVLISHSEEEARIGIPMIRDHRHVIDGLFDFIKGTRELSVSYIKELHSALLQNQDTTTAVDQFENIIEIPLSRGEFKKYPNNPPTKNGEVHQYCPPEQVESEMDNLITMYKAHVEKGYPPLATAAWLHHRFTQIHPFQDGNGRVARCLATLIFIKAEWFPLAIRNNDERDRYIDTLEVADAGDLSPLINLFATVQRRYFLGALSITEKVTQEPPDTETEESALLEAMTKKPPITAIIKSTTDKIKEQSRKSIEIEEKLAHGYNSAKKIADNLVNLAHRHTMDICKQIRQTSEGTVEAAAGQTKDSRYPRHLNDIEHPIVASHYGYHPNPIAYRHWVEVYIETKTSVNTVEQKITHIRIVFHGIGHEYSGIIVCSASCFTRDRRHLKFLSDEIFQINYKEPPEQIQKRFKEWLDKSIIAGLRIWHDSL